MTTKTIKSWISKAAILDAEIKEREVELKELKKKILEEVVDKEDTKQRILHGEKIESIKLLGAGSTKMTIAFAPTYSDICLDDAINCLNNLDKGDKLSDVVKVQVTALSKVVGVETVNTLREVNGFTNRISCKV